jgi:hypothetical protein
MPTAHMRMVMATVFRVNIILHLRGMKTRAQVLHMSFYHGVVLHQGHLNYLMRSQRLTIPASPYQLASGIQMVHIRLDYEMKRNSTLKVI